VPLRDAFLIGKAVGDPNARRVSVQLEKLSLVRPGGLSIESKVLGYVVGEDGLEGIPGTYEWRAWELAPLAVGAGALEGLSGALAQSESQSTLNPLGGATTVVTGDALRFAGFQAGASGAGKLGEIVAERMKEIRPAVSTPARSRVTVVFLEGVTLEGLEPGDLGAASGVEPFRGLGGPR
jgi:conjugal transfer pilus assembly protein TraB